MPCLSSSPTSASPVRSRRTSRPDQNTSFSPRPGPRRAHGRRHRLREARPDHIELSRLVVGTLFPAVAVLGQRDRLPAPLENRRLLEIDLAFDVLPDGRALDLTPEVKDPVALVLFDGHVVLRQSPGLAAQPAFGNTLGPEFLALPVVDDKIGPPSGCREYEEKRQHNEPCHRPILL